MGDSVLKTFAKTLKTQIRRTDYVGRHGGEEFLAILTDTGGQCALDVAERIRTACHTSSVLGPNNSTVKFTISVGVTTICSGESMESVLSRVDKGLYEAKRSGRDRAVLADD